MKKHIYIFSGLGADETVFEKIDFTKFNPEHITFIKWIAPLNNEPIENYANRISQQIKTRMPILLGISFGGMVVVEVAKQIETEKIILLASAKTKNEIPFYFKLLGLTQLHKIFPISVLKKSNFITNWFFDVNTQYEKDLLKHILKNTDKHFLKWAIDKIVSWKNISIPQNLTHIHGTRDKILPIIFTKNTIKIKHGGHLMTLNKFEELNKIIMEI